MKLPRVIKLNPSRLKLQGGVNKTTGLVFVIAFATIGSVLLFTTRAAGPFASIEPENGTLSRSDLVNSDSSASNASAIQFNAPPPSGSITHGQQINATNTGIYAAGLTSADLTTQAGGTFATDGQIIERKRFTDTVTLTGSNQILRNSIIEVPQGDSSFALKLNGSNALIENVLVRSTGAGGYICIYITGNGNRLKRVDSSNCENSVTTDGNNTIIEESFLHDPASTNPVAHHDVIEIYGGDNVIVKKSRLTMQADETAPINVAPWSTGNTVNGVTIEDSYIDGGNVHFIFDNQAVGISNARVLRNRLGGATNFGGYQARRGPDANDPNIVRTTAAQASDPTSVYWPITGADVNTWVVEKPLSPNLTGQIVD